MTHLATNSPEQKERVILNKLPSDISMGAVTLRVAAFDKMLTYYTDAIGLEILSATADSAVLGKSGQPAMILEHSLAVKRASPP